MPQWLVKNLVHLVYSIKHRRPWLPDDVRDSLFAYQAGIFKQWESPPLVIDGVEDHIHALFSLSKNPFRAMHTVGLLPQGGAARLRRCALPWADMLRPLRGSALG